MSSEAPKKPIFSIQEPKKIVLKNEAYNINYGKLLRKDENKSVFSSDKTTGASYMILGASGSGKTTFIVRELLKLPVCNYYTQERGGYSHIFIMTDSPYSAPFKMLEERKDITIIPTYCPKTILYLKKIQDYTKNKMFNWLIVLDDVIQAGQVRKGTFVRQILTLRNNRISTVFSTQYTKLFPPSVRSSVWHTFIFVQNMKSDDKKNIVEMLLPYIEEFLSESEKMKFIKTAQRWDRKEALFNRFITDGVSGRNIRDFPYLFHLNNVKSYMELILK